MSSSYGPSSALSVNDILATIINHQVINFPVRRADVSLRSSRDSSQLRCLFALPMNSRSSFEYCVLPLLGSGCLLHMFFVLKENSMFGSGVHFPRHTYFRFKERSSQI